MRKKSGSIYYIQIGIKRVILFCFLAFVNKMDASGIFSDLTLNDFVHDIHFLYKFRKTVT